MKEFIGGSPLNHASIQSIFFVEYVQISLIAPITQKIDVRNSLPLFLRRVTNSSLIPLELLESTPFPIPSSPLRVGEEIFQEPQAVNRFSTSSLTPLMQIPGLLEAYDVPLRRLNRKRIDGSNLWINSLQECQDLCPLRVINFIIHFQSLYVLLSTSSTFCVECVQISLFAPLIHRRFCSEFSSPSLRRDIISL